MGQQMQKKSNRKSNTEKEVYLVLFMKLAYTYTIHAALYLVNVSQPCNDFSISN